MSEARPLPDYMLFVNQPKVIAGIIHLYVPGEGGELIL
jgi:hypothetical protein